MATKQELIGYLIKSGFHETEPDVFVKENAITRIEGDIAIPFYYGKEFQRMEISKIRILYPLKRSNT